ncbi:MAG TPA: FtsQ-type POTRA domain-containing protein [Hanamia sp.]
MTEKSKYSFKKILVIAIWIGLGSGTIVLLVAAITRKNIEYIAGVDIQISGVQNNYFVDKKDVLAIMQKTNGQKIENANVGELNLGEMENALSKQPWVKSAEIFFDNNNVLQVKITEREPIARIFTVTGASFYIDSSLTRLPLSSKFSARLPVFTSFPTEAALLQKPDSILLAGIKVVSEYINAHPFWMAQVDQIDITPARTFELTPKLGDQSIRFGNADNCEQKFNTLLAFYKQVQTKVGWSKYSVIDVQYKNQVVAVNRDKAEIKSDSLRSVQIMKSIIDQTKKNSDDSTKIQLPQPTENNNEKISISRVVEDVPNETRVEDKIQEQKSSETKITVAPPQNPGKTFKKEIPAVKKTVDSHPSSNEKPSPAHSNDPLVKKEAGKEAEKKPAEQLKQVPKAVMPPKSDY